jgi:outer membrane protein assembly factor BamD (BamD/ComL family)
MKKILMISIFMLSLLFIGCPSKPVMKPGETPQFDTETPEGLYQEGQYYLKYKEYDYALRSFVTLAEDFSESILADDAIFAAGGILSNPKNPNYDLDEALEQYETLVDDYPDSPFVKKAQKQIDKIEKKLEKSD